MASFGHNDISDDMFKIAEQLLLQLLWQFYDLIILIKSITCFFLNLFFIFLEKLRQLTHVVGTLSHKGIARRALPASGGKDVDGGNRKGNKGE